MCGIAGIAGPSSALSPIIDDMLGIMQHRGPDAVGHYQAPGIHLGHCRLSINDLSARGRQPFSLADRSVAVVVNGEIYNYAELKRDLEASGSVFLSHSDSEVVLHAYLQSGLDFIPKLNGMFAFAIWDGRLGKIFLVRDRLGIKQLYYSAIAGSLLFASEIKALAQHPQLDLALDIQSFSEYLAFENYFSNRTLNRNIRLVNPGEIVSFTVADGVIERRSYWRPLLREDYSAVDDAVYADYLQTSQESVQRHLLSDVPIGSYLSAGIDSSTVAYWAAKAMDGGIMTYTGSFGLPGFYDEATDAARISTLYGCRHVQVEITPKDFIDHIERVIWHLDEPRVGMGSFSQYMVARRASEDVKVILTGHGGDEFFAGYPVFKAIFGRQDVLALLAHSSLREMLFFAYFAIYPMFREEVGFFLPNIFSRSSLERLLRPDAAQALRSEADPLQEPEALKRSCGNSYEQIVMTYLQFYLPSLFIVEDKISMAFSLESRTPLCDNAMLDLALSIPLAAKLRGYELKHIPRRAMRGRLPEFIYRLPKRGFPTPLRRWFKRELKEFIRDFIHDQMNHLEMFNRHEVVRIVNDYQRCAVSTLLDEINAHKIWILLNLICYFKNQKARYTGCRPKSA